MGMFLTLLILFLACIYAYHNWRIQPSSLYLSGVMMIIALLFVTHYVFIYGYSVFWMAVLFGQFTSFYYLFGPFLYFYVRGSLTDRPALQRRDLWHFLPALIDLALISPYIFQPWTVKWEVAEILVADIRMLHELDGLFVSPSRFNVPVRFVSMIGYTLYSLWMVWSFRSHYPGRMRIPLKDARVVFRFLLYLLVVCLLAEASFLVMIFRFFGDTTLSADYLGKHPMILLSGLGVLSIPVLIQLHPRVLYGIPRMAVDGDADPPSVATVTVPEEHTNMEPEDRFQLLAKEMLDTIEREQLFLDPDFTQEKLAEQLGVPKHHIYYCFSQVLNKRFTRLRAEYRVAYACKLIESGMTQEKTLEAIGMESGFGNRISFTNAFREIVGVSPREYLRKCQMAV